MLLGGAAAAGPVAGAQPGKVPRIGILVLGNPDPATVLLKEFREGLRELGYVEGQNDRVRISHRRKGSPRRCVARSPRELVALKVDIIVGFQTPAVDGGKAGDR